MRGSSVRQNAHAFLRIPGKVKAGGGFAAVPDLPAFPADSRHDRLFLQNAEIKQIKLDILRFCNKSAILLYKKCKNQVGGGRKRLLRIFNEVAHQRLRNGKGAGPFPIPQQAVE